MSTRSVQEIWETALGELQIQVSKSNYRTWLDKTVGLSYQDNQFVVGVPNTFVAEYLDKSLRSLIEKTLISLTQNKVTVVFAVNGREHQAPSPAEPVATATESELFKLNSGYTFDTFVVSNCNRMAYAAALGAAEKPGLRSYNPLYIYGGVGLGKTHLLHAMGHAAQANHKKVLFFSAEQFTTEFVNSIRERRTNEFRSKCRSTDMLLIDDIQFISGKEQTEESFFHIFNELHNADHQIVVTSNCLPRRIPLIDDRLRSRLEWGLTTGIQPPDFETRLAILQAKARREGVDVAPEVLQLIAEQVKQSVRELEGALNRVVAYARLLRAIITPELATEALQDVASKQPKAMPSPALLLEAVACTFQLQAQDLRSVRRDKQTTLARQVAMYLLREETGWPLSQIGQELGGREPITVSQACKKIASEMESNTDLAQKISRIQQELGHQ